MIWIQISSSNEFESQDFVTSYMLWVSNKMQDRKLKDRKRMLKIEDKINNLPYIPTLNLQVETSRKIIAIKHICKILLNNRQGLN